VIDTSQLQVKKFIFGQEPSNEIIYEWVLRKDFLSHLSPSLETVIKDKKVNPKRLQRQVHKEMKKTLVTKKSYEAMRLMTEKKKEEKREVQKQRREDQKQYLFERKRQKKKEKHRGR